MRGPSWHLVLLWGCALAVAAPTQRVGLIEDIPAITAQGYVEDSATMLVEIGEGGDDGCSQAYDKFKADVDKMSSLKDKAEKKVEGAEKKQKEAEAGLKRCDSDHKEIMEKATYKKEVADKKIKEEAKKEFDKMKKQVDDEVEA